MGVQIERTLARHSFWQSAVEGGTQLQHSINARNGVAHSANFDKE